MSEADKKRGRPGQQDQSDQNPTKKSILSESRLPSKTNNLIAGPTKVLAIVEGDKFIRFFADGPVILKTVQVPFYLTKECELALENLITQKLPFSWRQVYECHPIGFHNIRPITASDIIQRDIDLSLLSALNRTEAIMQEVSK
jgi:hypothetical protein